MCASTAGNNISNRRSKARASILSAVRCVKRRLKSQRSRSSPKKRHMKSRHFMSVLILAKFANVLRWLDKAAKACRESDEEFYACPSAECSWGCFMSTKEDGNIFTCQVCKYRYCIICEVPMHEGETCQEYQHGVETAEQRKQEQARENAESEQRVKKISKPCPKCKSPLDKYTGCDHVTCQCAFISNSIYITLTVLRRSLQPRVLLDVLRALCWSAWHTRPARQQCS